MCLEGVHEVLGVSIIDYGDSQVSISGKAWLGSRGDGEASDQGPLPAEIGQIGGHLSQRVLDAGQGRVRGQVPGRPSASPGRARNQALSRASISASSAAGCSRRSCSRIIASPTAYSSKASRRRSAAASGVSSCIATLYAPVRPTTVLERGGW